MSDMKAAAIAPTANEPATAQHAHERLMNALIELRQAEKNAVLWFAEIWRRQLYRQLGYGSIHQYATEALGFSKGKTSQFIRLSESLRSLPELERAVAAGDIPWTKAREVATVATRSTEGRWIEVARTSSRRDLERRIAETKAHARSARRVDASQGTLVGSTAGSQVDVHASKAGAAADLTETAAPIPSPIPPLATVQLRFTSEQLARFESLVEASHKRGRRGSREELVLEALEAELVEGDGSGSTASTETGAEASGAQTAPRVHRSPYHVVVYRCDSCGRAHVPTSRGDQAIDLATLRSIICDAEILGHNKRSRATVSPGKRRQVLQRDGHRCRAAGCRHTRFLHVHHLVPLELRGTDDVSNLVTLCRGCHTWVHERRERLGGIATQGAV